MDTGGLQIYDFLYTEGMREFETIAFSSSCERHRAEIIISRSGPLVYHSTLPRLSLVCPKSIVPSTYLHPDNSQQISLESRLLQLPLAWLRPASMVTAFGTSESQQHVCMHGPRVLARLPSNRVVNKNIQLATYYTLEAD